MKTIRVGVSGHRFLSDLDKLTTSLEKAYETLQKKFPNSCFQILSPLAEGADRLAASIFLQHSAELVAILPMPKEEYLYSFSSQESCNDFETYLLKAGEIIQLTSQPDHQLAYQALGLFLLETCDILIIIWDGLSAQGNGGTGEIADEARRRNIPMIWIRAGNRLPGTHTATSLGNEQGIIEFENFSNLESN